MPNENVEDSESDSNSAVLWTEREQYNVVTSLLVFLHITEKNKLYQTSHDLLKLGGYIYIEDFYRRTPEGEWIYGRRIHYSIQGYLLRRKHPSYQRRIYTGIMEEVGFVNVTFVDMTDSWSAFVNAR